MKIWWAMTAILAFCVTASPVVAKSTAASPLYERNLTLSDIRGETFEIELPNSIASKGDRLQDVNFADGDCTKSTLSSDISFSNRTIKYTIKPYAVGHDMFCYKIASDNDQLRQGKIKLNIGMPSKGQNILKGDVWVDHNLDYIQDDEPKEYSMTERVGWTVYLWRVDLVTGEKFYFAKTDTAGEYGIWKFKNVPAGKYVITMEVKPDYMGNRFSPQRPYSMLDIEVPENIPRGCKDENSLCLHDDNNFKVAKAINAKDDVHEISIDRIGDSQSDIVDVLANDTGPNGRDNSMLSTEDAQYGCLPSLGAVGPNDLRIDVGSDTATYHNIKYNLRPGAYGHDVICYRAGTSYLRSQILLESKLRQSGNLYAGPVDLTNPTYYFNRTSTVNDAAKANITIKPKETARIEGLAYVDSNLNKQMDDGEDLANGTANLETDYYQIMYNQPRIKSTLITSGKFSFNQLPAGKLDYQLSAANGNLQSDGQTFQIGNVGDTVQKKVRMWHPAIIKDIKLDVNVDDIHRAQTYQLAVLNGQIGSNGTDDDQLTVGKIISTDACPRPAGNWAIDADGKQIVYTLPANYASDTVLFCYRINNIYTGESYDAKVTINLHILRNSTISGTLYLNRNLTDGNVFLPNDALANVSLVLLDDDNHRMAAVTTDQNGRYVFGGLAAGTYHVSLDSGAIASKGDVGYTNNIKSGRKVGVFSKYKELYTKGEVWKD